MKQRLIGFALIAVFGLILAAIFVPVFSQAREKARSVSVMPKRIETEAAAPLAAAKAAAAPAEAAPADAAADKTRARMAPRSLFQSVAISPSPRAVYNPNLYLSSTYIGGGGARDRLETLIREGVLVDGKRVKLEAFAHSYAQSFPIPTRTALDLTADLERVKMVESGGRAYLQIGLQAIEGETPRRPPLNVALVIDCSGSMQGENKLPFARAAAAELVDRLGPDDVFSLVAFDDAARLLVPARRIGDTGKARAQAEIAALAPGGGTNIYGGLKLGYDEARRHAARAGGVSLVLLLSDGEVTAGVRDPAQFTRLVAGNVARDIQTTTVGMGLAFNEDLMFAIAREGRGDYHFLKDGADARTLFARELDQLTHIVAKAVQLRIQLAEGVGFVRALGSRKLSADETRQMKAEERRIDRRVYEELGIAPDRARRPDEPGVKLLIPNFYRGDNHVVMLELSVPSGRGSRKVADVFVKYKDLVARANREARGAATVAYTPHRAEMIASTNRAVKKNLLGFQTGEALVEAADLIAQNRVAEAVKKIDERMVVLGVAARQWQDRDLDRDGKLLDRYKVVLAQLERNPQMARSELGEYLKKSLTYNGYERTH